ncbi:MAG TPA: ExsB family protein [Candidatus Atribacteria bacterium]|nr:ExsB family protein [Candidatus Atribacteria bacterium]
MTGQYSSSVWAQDAIQKLREVASSFEQVVVAFSGGIDSTVALFLSLQALGKEKVISCTVDWDIYFPSLARENIDYWVKSLGVSHVYLPGRKVMEEIMKAGPSCNRCTKEAKLGTIRRYFGDKVLIVGGANQSDSWGKRGVKLLNNTYSPLFELSKEEIINLASSLSLPLLRIGENRLREGCLLKHLLKPLASPYQAQAVVKSNEILLKILKERNIERDIANVKIIGPLSRNVALVNVKPLPSLHLREEITAILSSIEEIDEVSWVDSPVTLIARANLGQYRNPSSLHWLEKGKLQPEFAFPLTIHWMPSSNRRLHTFQIVDFKKENTSYDQCRNQESFSSVL